MIKKFVYTLAAAALTAGFAACSSDEPLAGSTPGADGHVTFTAQLPAELASRAFGEGTTAKNLTVYVYEQGATDTIESKTTTFGSDLKATVDFQLVTGKKYDIVFWADAYGKDAAEKPFAYSVVDKTITVDYSVPSNDDRADAFFASRAEYLIDGAKTETITLTRPFAQINFGTDDLNAASVKNAFGFNDTDFETGNFGSLKSGLAVKTKVPNALNLLSGVASGSVDVTFAPIVPSKEDFPYESTKYKYLSMNYVLCGETRNVIDLDFTVYNGEEDYNTINIAAVPVQRNYRTNIYGSLITSKVNFTVIINPDFTTPDNNIKYWDGKVKAPVVNEEAKTVTINTPAEFAGFAKMVNEGNRLADYTVTLESDIDLANQSWEPIGNGEAHGEGGFYGVFDGKNHIVSNLNCTATGSLAVAGLFGKVTGMVKNVKVENARVVSDHYAGGVVAYVYKMNNLNDGKELGVVNCSINGGYIETRICDGDNADKAGGVVGGVWQGGATISNNKASNVTVKGYRHIGGVIGWMDWSARLPKYTVSNNEAENVTIIQDLSTNYNNIVAGTLIGPVVGATKVSNSTTTNQNITISGSKQSNINYVFENYSAEAEAPFNYNSPNYLSTLTLKNVKASSMSLNTTAKLTLEGCNIKAASTNPGGNNRFGIFLNVSTTPYYFTLKDCTLAGAWSHGIYVQGNANSKDSDANVIDITGCTFKDWGKKETSEADIKTSAAFKTIRTGNFATDEACKKWAEDFIKNNTFDAATLATGRIHTALGAGDQPSFFK